MFMKMGFNDVIKTISARSRLQYQDHNCYWKFPTATANRHISHSAVNISCLCVKFQ